MEYEIKHEISNKLYERTNYETSANFIKSTVINEYDLAKANISIMADIGIISEKGYDALAKLPKEEREKQVGRFMRDDPTISEKIKAEMVKLRQAFFTANNVEESQVVRIANDAIYLSRFATCFKFGPHEEFKLKNKYQLYAKVNNDISFFFGSEFGNLNMDVIGLGKDKIVLHEDYMLNFIGNLFWAMEFDEISYVMDFFHDFYYHYLSRELPIPYYRELNKDSMYRLRTSKNGVSYGVMSCNDLNQIDIGYNASVLRQLFGFIAQTNERMM